MSQPVKTTSFRSASGTKSLMQRRVVVGALAQADGAHLSQRADRLGQSAADGLDSGDHRGGHGAQADHHHSQFARGGRNLRMLRLSFGRLALQFPLFLLTFLFDCSGNPGRSKSS
jgi:hypothetical protein